MREVYKIPAALDDENKQPWILELESSYDKTSGKAYRTNVTDRDVGVINLPQGQYCLLDKGRIVLVDNSVYYVTEYGERWNYLEYVVRRDFDLDYPILKERAYMAEPLIPEIAETMGMHEAVTEEDVRTVHELLNDPKAPRSGWRKVLIG